MFPSGLQLLQAEIIATSFFFKENHTGI